MAFALRCPECRKAFKWMPSEPEPRFCPLCEADLGEPADDNVICLPAFLKPSTKNNDALYREFERSSEVRMEKAAEMAGVSKSEMSDLKVTNLLTDKGEGSIAAPPVVNEVTRHMDMLAARGAQVGWQGSNGAEYSAGVQAGPFPNVGAKMRTMIHQQNGMVSDRPALETQQPGYRIRG